MAYKASFATTGPSGGGPRVDLGTDANPIEYFVVGAYDNINNIDTKGRPLKIFSGTGNYPLNVEIVNLPNATTAPAGADLEAVVIDKKTGRLYMQ